MTYEAIGDALFGFVDEIDISAAKPDDWPEEPFVWGDKLDRPPKANELNRYPAFLVMPFVDTQETADTDTDEDAITYSVFVVVSFAEANEAERMIKQIVDIVRSSFRQIRSAPYELYSDAHDISWRGEWGGTPDQGERYYKMDVTVRVNESLVAP